MTKKIKPTVPPKEVPMNESAHVQAPLTPAQVAKEQEDKRLRSLITADNEKRFLRDEFLKNNLDDRIIEVVFVHAVVFKTGLSFLCLNAKHPNNLRWNIRFVIKDNFLYIFSDKEFSDKTVVVPMSNVKQLNCSDEGLAPERV